MSESAILKLHRKYRGIPILRADIRALRAGWRRSHWYLETTADQATALKTVMSGDSAQSADDSTTSPPQSGTYKPASNG